MGEAPDHYFSSEPTARSRPRTISVRTRGLDLTLRTDSGTFSPNRVDPGTAFLLGSAPPPPATGRFLDLGCGYGPIACTLASLSPDAEVIAVDVNERSRDLCRDNAAALGLSNVTVMTPDAVPAEAPDEGEAFVKRQGRPAAPGAIDLIWSNPPIRIGKPALHELLSTWLNRLSARGSAVLVVNRHLGADSLQRWLDSSGFPTRRLASKKGYRLLEVRRSDPGRVDGQA